MDRILKIVYCNPALHVSGGGERVLTVKANYFAENWAMRYILSQLMEGNILLFHFTSFCQSTSVEY